MQKSGPGMCVSYSGEKEVHTPIDRPSPVSASNPFIENWPLIVSFRSSDSPNAALTTILDRLQRLEARTVASGSQANGNIPTPSVGGSEASQSPVAFSTTNGYASSILAPRNAGQEMDAMTVLKDAVDRVQELRKRSFGSSVITKSIDIPTDLAKTWVASKYCSYCSSHFSSNPLRLLQVYACLYVC